jgi:1L-myo-inositol 1-phosphate cytidylyltransferase
MTAISQAVILMAGAGTRLRGPGKDCPKPLVPVLGRPLVSYTINALARAQIRTINAVVGFEGAALAATLKPLVPASMQLRVIENADWRKQNGISLLAAEKHVDGPFLLTMSDHIFDESIVDLLLRAAIPDQINLAIDRKLDSIFDRDDATKVQTRGNNIVMIGKDLPDYDAIDTGLFVCSPAIFQYLNRAKRNGDCSLSDGVRAMAADGKAHAIDIGESWWQDVDTEAMLAAAEDHLRTRLRRNDPAGIGTGPQPVDCGQ